MRKIFAWIGAFALVLSTGYVVDAQDFLKVQAGYFEGAFYGKTATGAVDKVIERGTADEVVVYGGSASTGHLDLRLANSSAKIRFVGSGGGASWTVDDNGVLDNPSGGNLNLTAPGTSIAIEESSAAAACMGTVTFNGTTAVTKSTTCVTSASRVFLTPTSDPTGSTAAYCWVTNIVNGVSFDVDCDQANDGTANWFIIKEAA